MGKKRDQVGHRTTGSEPSETTWPFFDSSKARRKILHGSWEVDTVLRWIHAAKKAGKWSRRILEAAERFVARWHVEEEKKSSEHRAARMRDAQSRKGDEGSREIAVEENKKKTADRVCKAPGRLVRRTCLSQPQATENTHAL